MERDDDTSRSAAAGDADRSAPDEPAGAVTARRRDEGQSGAAASEDGPDATKSGAASGEPGTPDDTEFEVIERRSSPRDLAAELIPELGLIALAVYLFYLAGTFQNQAEQDLLGPGFWPRLAAAGLTVALVVRIVQIFRERNRPIVKVHSEFDEFEEKAELDWGRTALAMALAVAYVLSTMFLGYLISTALFLGVFIWLGGQRNRYVPLVAIGGALVTTYVFIGIVFVSLPTGVGVFDTVTVAIYRLLGLQ